MVQAQSRRQPSILSLEVWTHADKWVSLGFHLIYPKRGRSAFCAAPCDLGTLKLGTVSGEPKVACLTYISLGRDCFVLLSGVTCVWTCPHLVRFRRHVLGPLGPLLACSSCCLEEFLTTPADKLLLQSPRPTQCAKQMSSKLIASPRSPLLINSRFREFIFTTWVPGDRRGFHYGPRPHGATRKNSQNRNLPGLPSMDCMLNCSRRFFGFAISVLKGEIEFAIYNLSENLREGSTPNRGCQEFSIGLVLGSSKSKGGDLSFVNFGLK